MLIKQIEEAVFRLRTFHNYRNDELIVSMSVLVEKHLVQEYLQQIRCNYFPTDGIKQIVGIEINTLWPYNSEIMVYRKTLAYIRPDLLIKIETGFK